MREHDDSTDDDTARVLRRVLGEEAAMVDPTPAPSPEAEEPRQRRWVPALAVAAGVVTVAALGAGALGVLGDDGPDPIAAPTSAGPSSSPSAPSSPGPSQAPSKGSSPEPTQSAGSTSTPSTEPTAGPAPTESDAPDAATFAAEVWYVTDPSRPALVPEAVQIPGAMTPVTAALEHLLSSLPTDPDYSNGYWTPASEQAGRPAPSVSANITETGTTVDISGDAFSEGLGSEFAYLALQQLVHTVVANGGDAPVTVLVDGAAGADAWGAISFATPAEQDRTALSVGWISSPQQGSTVPAGSVTITGVATGYEGEVDWEVLDASGNVVEAGFTSSGANGELGDVQISVNLTAGRYTARLFDASEASEGEGPPVIFEDTKAFTVG